MKKPVYPLAQVALIKEKRLEEAEKTLKEKKEIYDLEVEKLQNYKKKLEEVQKLKEEKIQKHFEEMSKGITSKEIEVHERYIKDVVNEQLNQEQSKVNNQKKTVKAAEEEVEKARKDRLKKHQEVEKMSLHKKEWKKEVGIQEARDEAIEADELGSNIHNRKRHIKHWSSKGGKRK